MDDVLLKNRLLRIKLEEAVTKMDNQTDRITNLEESVKKIENQAKRGTCIENAIQNLNNLMDKLEKIIKQTEETVSFTLKEYFNDMNKTFSYLKQEIKTCVDKNERNLEKPPEATDKESGNPIESLNEANDVIQKLKTRIVKVGTRQGKRAAFLARRAEKRSNGKLRFTKVHLNKRSAYDNTSGVFTCPFPGLYSFTATVIEMGDDVNHIACGIRKNRIVSAYMYFITTRINGARAIDGSASATAAATMHLVKGDRVFVYCIKSTDTSLFTSSFSSCLVSANP
ncbi:uncharacterized protein LOC128552581 [Mercenaria mercenaria]|uniref:uncharacterized protein LOC128552581 n=1 Tax=Mercenaria mercenaria TaxID=6596 RepID=UPI00234EA56B|nr:uncharacterized protein LOC128552581 [Mercenaria mercenaria]